MLSEAIKKKQKSRSRGLKSHKADFVYGELWKDIDGYEGYYQISNIGRIKRLIGQSAGCLVKPILQSTGYYAVMLSKEKVKKIILVHRLVAKSFIPKQEGEDLEVNHINGNRGDFRIENLEWVTHSENIKHADRTGLRKMPSGADNSRSKKVVQMTLDWIEIATFDSMLQAQKKIGINNSAISACCLGKIQTAGGYKWKYA